ncbi:hypothetical protein GGR92_000026 [Spirosoma lacussanchae]|uniref:hypothetical protein n=1 Tax=Spirosoma lacussanchae TaxID=1884249 RepID=UPI001109E0FE|nr:hypothetical protein [Spirosoma lacussanchae]
MTLARNCQLNSARLGALDLQDETSIYALATLTENEAGGYCTSIQLTNAYPYAGQIKLEFDVTTVCVVDSYDRFEPGSSNETATVSETVKLTLEKSTKLTDLGRLVSDAVRSVKGNIHA